ncbi:MAG: co-chaperone GroES [Candidatus Yonathbacteria bacterium CG_4_10_14_3_um_filter_47_65]|uniref:Co-chaperonin GroES n=2 Tax=Parcubacteria group TaxID=1794811 RepID=A0A2M8D773_9BACT|nr:MAG: co-chaperone GroES [Candidatus Nomurabacteria bacterium CG1_02_47_685]PIP03159.1 MAG: co-chaperone GroES [Candidatus Yonathbacteria bacterium CG23_combo_of_CG06-09_8_20_14_all_46_18]PIQ32740.1 MAG: co-chaperone GroES [Candidatus Yonathbacteria bacterium CG17_big_fil_post_rev_8_21_14_2_50_46_19]PIX55968.1 MAG: co-chaperone GroES [Candidatus Yonathbacteria bacterium CG_4_10_14_3_um_filter_47_65]PIY57669.1 MAG: co-chaperone GroES [Candidatus Yonathbacteria bacterium CG_4_10_14_0_8_um_filte
MSANVATKKKKIMPLHDRVLVKPISADDAKKTASGIIIPETVNKEKPEQGKVIAVGDGKINDDGKVLPLSVHVGDVVVFSKYGPDEIKVDGEEYYIIREDSILAVIK